jgi:hypothetical protein
MALGRPSEVCTLQDRRGQKFRAGLGQQRETAEQLALPIHIDDRMLDSLDFMAQITTLREPALSDYYARATKAAVRLPEKSLLGAWQALLQG